MNRRKLLSICLAGGLALVALPNLAVAYDRAAEADARAMLDRAMTLYEADGLDAMITAVSDSDNSAFHDRDLYVLVTTVDGDVLAHGVSPALVGKNFIGLKDADGKEFVKEFIAIMDGQTEGVTQYKWKNNANGQIELKTVFMRRLGDGPVVSVGIYEPNT